MMIPNPNVIFGIALATMGLVTVVVGTRLGIRAFGRGMGLGMDDWFMVASAVCMIRVQTGLQMLMNVLYRSWSWG